MNLILLLTAMLSALAGAGRPVATRAAAVESSRMIAVAQAVAPAAHRARAERPDGYVAPEPLRLDLRIALRTVRAIAPERRRE